MASDFEHRDNSGSMFHNQRKTQDNHPDRTGSCKIDGRLYRVSGWIKPGKGDKPAWLSLAFTPEETKDERMAGAAKSAAKANREFDNMDDDIPF